METNPSLMGFIRLVSQLFSISELEAAFWVGGIVIAVVTGIVGRIAFRMAVWGRASRAANETMIAFTIRTPNQVIREGRIARINLLITWILLFSVACLIFYLSTNRTGGPQTVIQVIQNLVRSFLSP